MNVAVRRAFAPRLFAATRASCPQSWNSRPAVFAAAVNMPRWCSSSTFNMETHPREWAVFVKMDLDHDNILNEAEIRQMCRQFDTTASAPLLVSLLDPDGTGCNFETFVKHFLAVRTVRVEARRRHWNRTYGLGVAGNVAGHMAQAGEADAPPEDPNFPDTDKIPNTPAAVFTFYAPHPHSIDATEDEILEMIEEFPVTNAVLDYPAKGGRVQVEPELGLYVDLVYSKDGSKVERLIPRRVAAFNDCSIRELEGSTKLTEKKNWGEGSKGISLRSIRIDSLSKGSYVDKLVLTSFVKRDGVVHQYSVNAPARNYMMFHDELLEWIVNRINHQKNEGKWLPIWPQLVASDYPTSMWIALGAGEYTEWGEKNFLERKDEVLVMVYDEVWYPKGPSAKIVEGLMSGHANLGETPAGIVALHQVFV